MFTTKLQAEETSKSSAGRPIDRLLAPLVWNSASDGISGLPVTVPKDFETDYASVPFWLRWIFHPRGPWRKAPVVHDYLCVSKIMSRFLADSVYREIMRELGAPWWRRVAMYYGVRTYATIARIK